MSSELISEMPIPANQPRSDLINGAEAKSDSAVSAPAATSHTTSELTATYPPPASHSSQAYISSLSQYESLYARSISSDPSVFSSFWSEIALSTLTWFAPFTSVSSGSFEDGSIAWFLNGKLNISYNCIDRHLPHRASQTALLFEGDEESDIRRVTYAQLHTQVCTFANALKSVGVKRGDVVAIYMPMVPQAAIAMLACTRIGAVTSVVFAGFSADALRERVVDGGCRFVITADEGKRAGKNIPLKATTDEALKGVSNLEKVIIYQHTGASVPMIPGRDVWWHEITATQRAYCPPEWMDSEDPLLMLFTSGSTGKPKGILHTTGGYATYVGATTKFVFDVKPDTDVYACMADVGWVTGHSYIVYGPLINGATTFMFESTPLYPSPSRYWAMVERHKISVFYTAPTAIRAVMKFGNEPVQKHDLSSLRILGSVGEPINPEAWLWYYQVVGGSRCTIQDTYWQTETGGHILTPFPGAHSCKPGSAVAPFFGIEPLILDPTSGKVLEGNGVSGILVLGRPWPGIARTCFGDHQRYLSTYMKPYKGYYTTGDGAYRDADGYIFITGRVDDVVNVSGHRIGSAEVESALVTHAQVTEAAVIGIPHDLKGQSLFCYVIPKAGFTPSAASNAKLVKELVTLVRTHIGAFAAPDDVVITDGLPKTRSGKIMRRLLRKIACAETDSLGDTSTLADETVVAKLISEVTAWRQQKTR